MTKVIQSMFYNANYNLGYPDGQSKFIWGVQQIDFSKNIQEQLIGDQEVFNFNLTSLNPIFDPCHDENKLVEENQRLTAMATKQAERANELYVALGSLLDASTRDITEDELHLACEIARKIYEKSRIEAEQENG